MKKMSPPPDIFQMGIRWTAIYISNNHDEAVAAGFSLRLTREIFALITQPKVCLPVGRVAATFFRGSRDRVEYNLERRTRWRIN